MAATDTSEHPTDLQEASPASPPLSGEELEEEELSVAGVENAFVSRVYRRLATVYDWVFGPTLHQGRVIAIRRMDPQPGEHILEVGIGTGITADLYPEHCRVTGIDFSESMLDKARRRLEDKKLEHVALAPMDAADLDFPDDSFDIVYAAYVMSVVPDPVRVAREMKRVCRPGGRVIFLNHFRSPRPWLARIERWLSPLTVHVGFKSDLDLERFLRRAGLEAESVEKVNFPRLWSLVTCRPGHRPNPPGDPHHGPRS